MKKLLLTTLLVGLAVSVPTPKVSKASQASKSKENKKIVITKESFRDEFRLYTSDHDVIQVLYPFNTTITSMIFYVEADIVNGVIEYKGVKFMMPGAGKRLLNTGTYVATDDDYNLSAYIAATDGLYKYNAADYDVDKYGNINDSLIGVAKVKGADVIYVLTADNVVYKVTERGTKKVRVNDVVGAKQIVLDNANNLYYYGADNQPYVKNKNGVKKIAGLPSKINEITLINPPTLKENGIPAVVNNKAYIIFANGTKADTVYEFVVKPSAYSIEGPGAQLYAHDKKLYLLDLMSI